MLAVDCDVSGTASQLFTSKTVPPTGGWGLSDVTLLSGISGLSFGSAFLSPVSFIQPVFALLY